MRHAVLSFTVCAAMVMASAGLAWSEDRQDEAKRVKAAADILNEIMATPDKGIPQEIMDSAKCVGVVPSMKKGGFVFGAEYGKGVATCHNSNAGALLPRSQSLAEVGDFKSAAKPLTCSC
jgi:lipid-binding SYLF domain-containing protein